MSGEPSQSNIDWSVPLWDREKPRKIWDPSRRLLKTIRHYQYLRSVKPLGWRVRLKLCVLGYRFWSIVTGAEIDLNCNIGGGLLIPHPNGIVIHPDSEIGINCLIFQQVTLAGKVNVGNHVDIGAGAKLLGPLIVGDDSRIGANAVVTKNVDQRTTVIGVPAK